MSRYIDAEKLIGKIRCLYPSIDCYCTSINAVPIKDINNVPTADVQEVRYGRWRLNLLDNFKKVECTCTHCGWSFIDNSDSYVDISDFEYCPHCGAKMDGENEQTT